MQQMDGHANLLAHNNGVHDAGSPPAFFELGAALAASRGGCQNFWFCRGRVNRL